MGKVLIVDDNELILRLARAVLTREGHAVTTAHSLGEAKVILSAGDPDLVVTDENMPGGSGLELVRWLHEEQPRVRTVLMSGKLGSVLSASARDLGVSRTLQKPFTNAELSEVVSRVLSDRPTESGNEN